MPTVPTFIQESSPLSTASYPASSGEPTASAKTPPKASVVVVNYNGLEYLGPCLQSVLSTDGDLELIVLDNGSTDGSAEWVADAFPAVKLVRSETNLGFGGGNNRAAAEAQGDYLVFLNPDTVVTAGWLEALVSALEENPDAGLATARVLLWGDPKTVNTCGNDVHISGLTLCRGMGAPCDATEVTQSAEVSAVSGAAFAMPRGLFEALEGFDARFFLYMEDTDLSLRARLAGYRCLYIPEAVVYHDYALRFGSQKTFFQERNRYLMVLKTMRWGTLAALAPAFLLAEVVTWGFVLLHDRERLRNKVRAYSWLISHWPEIMATRRRAQASRQIRDRQLVQTMATRLSYEQAGNGPAARWAHRILDPLFWLCRLLALAVVWW